MKKKSLLAFALILQALISTINQSGPPHTQGSCHSAPPIGVV